MNDIQRRINDMMKEEGLTMVRHKGKHTIWSDGKITVSVPRSTSDHRAFKNKRAEIRRLRLLGKPRVYAGNGICPV